MSALYVMSLVVLFWVWRRLWQWVSELAILRDRPLIRFLLRSTMRGGSDKAKFAQARLWALGASVLPSAAIVSGILAARYWVASRDLPTWVFTAFMILSGIGLLFGRSMRVAWWKEFFEKHATGPSREFAAVKIFILRSMYAIFLIVFVATWLSGWSPWTAEITGTPARQGAPDDPVETTTHDASKESASSADTATESSDTPAHEAANQQNGAHLLTEPPMVQETEPADFRTWTDITGKFQTEAAFVSVREDKVVLRKRNDVTIEILISQLSEADREWVETRSGNTDSRD